MDSAVRKALIWVVLGVGVMMSGFTALDLGSDVRSTALWLAMIFWPVVVGICWWILAADRNSSDTKENE